MSNDVPIEIDTTVSCEAIWRHVHKVPRLNQILQELDNDSVIEERLCVVEMTASSI